MIESNCTVGTLSLGSEYAHLVIDDQVSMEIRDVLELRSHLEKKSRKPLWLIVSIGTNFSMGLAAREEFLQLPNVSKFVIVADTKAKRFLTKLTFDSEIRDERVHVFSVFNVALSWCRTSD